MNKIKLTAMSLFMATLTALSCWWTTLNYNGNYIAGVNNFQTHYSESSSIEDAIYHNGMYVALPLTVYVKVSPLEDGSSPITRAVLQYRVRRSGSWLIPWITVKTLTNPSARTWYGQVVPLFGNGTIDPRGLQSGDEIIIRYYITNGVLESGDLEDSLEAIDPNDTETYNDHSDTYSGGWSPPFVFKVIYNGQRRVSW